MARQSLSAKSSRPFGGPERAVILPAPTKVEGRHTMLDPKKRSAVTPGRVDAVRAGGGPLGRPIWEAAVEMDRFARRAIRRFSNLVADWLERGVEGHRLQQLSDHMLKDIGAQHHDIDYRRK